MAIKETTLIQSGMIVPYLGGVSATPPSGWLYCDGTEKNKNDYPDLYAVISGVYGTASNPTNKFVLPGPMRIMRGSTTPAAGVSLSTQHSHSGQNANITINLAAVTHNNHAMNTPYGYGPDSVPHSHSTNLSDYLSNANSSVSSANANLSSGNANFLAADNHSHALNTYLPGTNMTHSHDGTAGNISASNSHSHALSASVAMSTSNSDGDYPPYILVWHIIKT